jgi:hypothetical protein
MLRHVVAIATCWLSLAAAAAASPPRLLVVQKPGQMAFMLSETHIGTPEQLDSYFWTTVQPAFNASSLLLLEKGDTTQRDDEYAAKACAQEGPDEAALDAALDAAIAGHPTTPAARLAYTPDKLAQTSRFYRFDLLLRGLVTMPLDAASPVADDSATSQLLPPLSARLLAAAPRPWRSLDSLAANFRAYCALAPADRAVLLSHFIDLSNRTAAPMRRPGQQCDIDEATFRTETLDEASLGAITATLAGRNTAPPATNRRDRVKNTFLLVERNRGWMAQLPEVFATQDLPFFAIGAAHFIDGDAGPGLITMLRAAGYTVAPVRDAQHLRALLDGRHDGK